MHEIERLAPWMYEFEFPDGTATPLLHEGLRSVHHVRRSMLVDFLDAVAFDPAASVLDLACNEGYFSFELVKRGARHAIGIDARERNIEKAAYVRERLGLHDCEFLAGDVTEMDLTPFAADCVLLLGILYHVEDPIRLMRRAAASARRLLVVETQLTRQYEPVSFGWGSRVPRETAASFAMLRENPNESELNSVGGFSLVPNAPAVVAMLRDIGFRSILQLHPARHAIEPQYEHVDRAMFAALW